MARLWDTCALRVGAVKVTAQIKRKAMDTQETRQQIIAKAVTSMTAGAATQMPAVRTMRIMFCKLVLGSLYWGLPGGCRCFGVDCAGD